ncbi:MAG TPA: hypothetical protein VFU88_03530 [Ktedonobacterales bacterium]|nr:hypothetical protein [Ktedonobacterales bacterium]
MASQPSGAQMTAGAAGAPAEEPEAAWSGPALRDLVLVAAAIEAFFLALMAAAPVGGISQTISPLVHMWPWLLAPARLIFGRLAAESVPPERGWPALALFAGLMVGASAAAALVVPLCRRRPGGRQTHLWLALGGAAVLGLTLLLLPSLPSDDVFSYILYGRISALHGANPLVAAPSSFPDDPFLRLVFWQGTRSVYGPGWLLLSAGLTHVAEALGGQLATYVLLYKLVGFAAHLANSALIWAILGLLAPRRRLLGTLLYAWNPLCLLEFCASAHNDALMLTLALAGIYCLARGWEGPALLCFGLSISVKYVWLALVPLYLIWVARRVLAERAGRVWQEGRAQHARTNVRQWYERAGIRAVVWAVLWRVGVVVGVMTLTALPFWAGTETLGALAYSPPAQQLDNSLLELAQWPLRAVAGALGVRPTAAASVVQAGLKLLGLGIFALVWVRAALRTRDLGSLLVGWGWVLFWYAAVASGWFWPWYATWALALAALVAREELLPAALLLAGGVLTLYAFIPLYAAPVYGLRALIAFGPALGYLVYSHRAEVVRAAGRLRTALERANRGWARRV